METLTQHQQPMLIFKMCPTYSHLAYLTLIVRSAFVGNDLELGTFRTGVHRSTALIYKTLLVLSQENIRFVLP